MGDFVGTKNNYPTELFLIGPSKLFADFLTAIGVNFGREVVFSDLSEELERAFLKFRRKDGDENLVLVEVRKEVFGVQGLNDPVKAEGKAGGGNIRSAETGDKTVITAATAEGTETGIGSNHFYNGAGVVVQATDKIGVKFDLVFGNAKLNRQIKKAF